MKRLIALLVVALLALCLCAPALSDVAVGDKGEEVRYLQWLLRQIGYLDSKPDGVFGPRTEQAVMAYQEAKGLEATGVADAELMLEMDRDRVRRDKEEHGQDYYEPYTGKFEPPMTANQAAASHCSATVLPGIAYRNTCDRHLELASKARTLIAAGDADSLEQATTLWLEDIADTLTNWSKGKFTPLPSHRQQLLEAWTACFEAQRAALGEGEALALMLQNVAQALCELQAGQLPEKADMESIGLSGEDGHCARWALTAENDFITACATHAPLFEQEQAWVSQVAEDAESAGGPEAIGAAWDAALGALYDEWVATNPQAQAAREAFDAALALQDSAMSGCEGVALGHMRLVQLESARLCELLHAQG